ncbi:MAG: ABC transporter ATP-binding protein [Spirochaetales bacterium]|nr:ABC transporter ATP-binding protein [Spirochaetales bacterium]
MNDLSVENLSIRCRRNGRIIVRDLSFSVASGECLGILGESGSGKSMSCRALLGLLDKREFEVEGRACYKGEDLLSLGKGELRRIRGRKISMVLQNPMSCFDPMHRMGDQVRETLRENSDIPAADLKNHAVKLLEQVGLNTPEEILRKYPCQLSGGMLQRVMIALALQGDLIIADEPTTAVDAVNQYEILQELKRINKTMIFVSHDLGAVSCLADSVLVMKNGQAEELQPLNDLLSAPRSEFTKELLASRREMAFRYRSLIRKKREAI